MQTLATEPAAAAAASQTLLSIEQIAAALSPVECSRRAGELIERCRRLDDRADERGPDADALRRRAATYRVHARVYTVRATAGAKVRSPAVSA